MRISVTFILLTLIVSSALTDQNVIDHDADVAADDVIDDVDNEENDVDDADRVEIDDMVVTRAQQQWLFGRVEDTDLPGTNRTKRAGHKLPSAGVMFWPNGEIPFRIELTHFKKPEREEIRQAMDVWEEMTCVKFVDKSYMHKTYLFLVHTSRGCFSQLGVQPAKGPQTLSLQDPGCRHFGTYLHELGHAIGLVHEHQLPTRDGHINYYMTNVDPNKKNQLELFSPQVINTYKTPYDLGSIMHYNAMSFSVDDMSITLGSDNPWLYQHIGRRYSNMISFGDARTVNELYQCSKHCDMNQRKACQYPGYLDQRCDCITPQVYDNRYCKDEDGMDQFCNNLAPQGLCDIKNIEHHKNCRRTCDFCPRFLPGNSAIGKQQLALGYACVDRYRDPRKCAMWKSYCSKSRWMHRNCRLTCGACKSTWGDCPNIDPDNLCDRYAAKGFCQLETAKKDFIKFRCQDSCGVCGFRKESRDCRNVESDEKCTKWAKFGACEKKSLQMFEKCPSTCDRCYFNKGNCKNQQSEPQCTQWGLQNFCVKGSVEEMQYVRSVCGRTCDSCPTTTG